MDKTVDNAVNVLVEGILSACKSLIEKASFDKTYTGIVSEVTKDGYVVNYQGNSTVRINGVPTTKYKVGEQIRICFPQNNRQKAFIVVDLAKL